MGAVAGHFGAGDAGCWGLCCGVEAYFPTGVSKPLEVLGFGILFLNGEKIKRVGGVLNGEKSDLKKFFKVGGNGIICFLKEGETGFFLFLKEGEMGVF